MHISAYEVVGHISCEMKSDMSGTAPAVVSRRIVVKREELACYGTEGNWTTCRYANSRTGQVADWTTRDLADAAKKEN